MFSYNLRYGGYLILVPFGLGFNDNLYTLGGKGCILVIGWLFGQVAEKIKKKALIISTLYMYSNSLRIMQNQEIKDNHSLIVISSHISSDSYEVLGLPYHDFRLDMLTSSLLCF